MRLRTLALAVLQALLAALPVSAEAHPGVAAGAPTDLPVKRLEVVIHTYDDWGAGTHDQVTLSLGDAYEWVLDQPGAEAFEHGHTSRFQLAPRGLHASDVRVLRLRKSRGGDDWFLGGIELWVDGRPFYRSTELNRWLTDERSEWSVDELQQKRES